jgi:hypothetical protein
MQNSGVLGGLEAQNGRWLSEFDAPIFWARLLLQKTQPLASVESKANENTRYAARKIYYRVTG